MTDLPTQTPGDPLAQLFPGPSGLGRPPRRRARRALAGGAAAAVLLLGGVAVASAGEPDGGGVRTAAVAEHTVDQVLRSVATVEPVSQASVAFPVAGTVSKVDVKVGDTVVVGKPLATLDTVSLERTLHEKQATLAEAELKLEKALDGEDVGGTGGAPSGAPGSATGISLDTSSSSTASTARTISYVTASTKVPATTAPTAGQPVGASGAPSGSTDAELRVAQQAVLDAQKAVDASLVVAQQALESATQVCAMTGTDVPTPPATGEGSSTSTPPTQGSTAGASVAACQEALQAVLAAQQQVAADQAALATASSTLNDLIEARATTPDTGNGNGNGTGNGGATPDAGSVPSGGPSTGGAPTGSNGPSTTGSPATGGTDTTTTSPSAEALVAYQKAVDAAEAQVTVAQQAVAQATIVSPISGTVASVGFAVGDEVTAASSTQTVVVVGDGGYEVTTAISVDDIPDVKVGQAVTVTPDGSSKAIRGEVVRIGVAATSGTSSTTYTVTIGLTGDTSGLGNGATASVAIVTDAAAKAVSVPTSAVTVNGDRHTVEVVDGDTTKTVTVKVGAVGDVWTEITSGVKVGQEVVIADLSEPLPGSATSSSSNGQNGQTGDRPAFTAGPGGFPGGPPSGARPGG